MKTLIVALTLLLSAFAANAQKIFTNAYKISNNDGTLRLDYIEHREKETVVYVKYVGNFSGLASGLYLNDYKLAVHSTGEVFRAISSTVPFQQDSKFFLQNSTDGIQLQIRFPRLPAYVKEFDLIEPSTDQNPTFNFTFRNLKVDDTKDVSWELSGWAFEAKTPRFIQIFTNSDMPLDVYLNENFVGSLAKKFPKDYKPTCGEYGALRIAFADSEKKNIKIIGHSGGKSYTWTFQLSPLLYCQDIQVNL